MREKEEAQDNEKTVCVTKENSGAKGIKNRNRNEGSKVDLPFGCDKKGG